MGQRLVITVRNNQKDICNIYYHWSAYTRSALDETKRIIDCICDKDDVSEKDLLLRLIHFCENMGGGIPGGKDSDEWKYIHDLYPNETFKAEGISRNYGLIALSEDEMKNSQQWSEGDVIIDLDEDIVNFGIFCDYENLEEYIEARRDWDDEDFDIKLEDIFDVGCDIGFFRFDEIEGVIDALDSTNNWVVRNGNVIYELTA
jgi:hypothetical protein